MGLIYRVYYDDILNLLSLCNDRLLQNACHIDRGQLSHTLWNCKQPWKCLSYTAIFLGKNNTSKTKLWKIDNEEVSRTFLFLIVLFVLPSTPSPFFWGGGGGGPLYLFIVWGEGSCYFLEWMYTKTLFKWLRHQLRLYFHVVLKFE